MIPNFIVETNRYGWNHGGQFRFATDEKNVRNIVKGIRTRYPDAEIRVHAIDRTTEVPQYVFDSN